MADMSPVAITLAEARRLAIVQQQLTAPRPGPATTPNDILALLRAIRCLQLDPIRAVERTHLLVLWSRLGNFDPAGLDFLRWESRQLFEYWAHAASIVLTEDYPIFRYHMEQYAAGHSRHIRTFHWLAENQGLREHVLQRLEADGPLASAAIEDLSDKAWQSTGWTNGRNVPRMLDVLWTEGVLAVAGRNGNGRQWDLAERWLPDWTPRRSLPPAGVSTQGAEHALRALGVATAQQIKEHFLRGGYPDLPGALAALQQQGRIRPVQIMTEDGPWPETWYIHADALPQLARLRAGEWQPQTTLLSPFDNLICDRKRTEQLFDFYYRVEIYVPAARRQYGYYVLPILHGDRLIGRLDPKMDRKTGRLHVNAAYTEAGVDWAGPGRAVCAAISELAPFLGANEIIYGPGAAALAALAS